MVSIGKRIQQLLKVNNVNPSQLSQEIGVQRSTFSHIINGRNKPSLELITKLKKQYPDLSFNWLLLGKGEMYESQPPQAQMDFDEKIISETSHVPNESIPLSSEDSPPTLESSTLSQPTSQSSKQVYILFPDGTFKLYDN
jgi:transcriptional regulator with XRE-family HTH domain